MEKIWFIGIDDQQHGPYNISELKKDKRLTPETLVWREGFVNWTPLKRVKELKDIFKDELDPNDEDEEDIQNKKIKLADKDEIAIDMQKEFPPFLWIILFLIAISYIMYRFFGH